MVGKKIFWQNVDSLGEALTHNPGMSLCNVYNYHVLTNSATRANCRNRVLQGVGIEPTQSYDYESLNLTL